MGGGNDMVDHAGDISMFGPIEVHIAVALTKNLGNVAAFRTDVQYGGADPEYVVDLARMNDAHERVAHNHQMKIGSGQTPRQLVERLVRQANNILVAARADALL